MSTDQIKMSAEDTAKVRAMRPGMWVDVQADTPTASKRARTDLIGVDYQRQILILRMPDEIKNGNLRDAFYVSNEIIMRLIIEDETGAVIAFKSEIKSILAKPLNYILVDFPAQMQSHTLRSEDRARTSIPVAVLKSEEAGDGDATNGQIVDISGTGCRLSVPKGDKNQIIATNQEVKMTMKKPSGESLSLEGVVMNSRSEPLNVYYGIKFDTSKQEVLKELLLQIMIEY